jgi:hypothetical protein
MSLCWPWCLLAAAVEALFHALCDASALNPDSDMEEVAGAQLFFDEAEVRLPGIEGSGSG